MAFVYKVPDTAHSDIVMVFMVVFSWKMADETGLDLIQCSFPSTDERERDSLTCVEYPGAKSM